MNLRRLILLTVVLVAGLATVPGTTPAAGFPERPVNLVVAFAAGGPSDIIVRALHEKFGEKLGAPAVVLNKPGSGGLVGAEFVAKARPDGYNILFLSLSHLLRQAIDPKMTINMLKDFELICTYVSQPMVVVVKGDSRYKTLEDLVEYGLKNPGKLNFGSAGIGSTGHFAGELFKTETKVKQKHVPFAGDAPTITALMGGHIDFLVTGTPAVVGKVASGDLRLLATFQESRVAEIKDVPTFTEKGYAKATMYSWFGFALPAGAPKDVTAKLESSMKAAIKDPAIQTAIANLGFNEIYRTPADATRFAQSELDRFTKIAKDENIKVE